MPKLDGLAVLDRIRADHTLKNRPTFLMISGISNEKITEDAFERGADYYIMKPFDRNIVLDRIKTLNRRKTKYEKKLADRLRWKRNRKSTRYRHWKRMSQR